MAALSVEIGRAILRDGARGDLVAELRQFGGDDLLTPCGILAPHPPDELAEICIDGGTARWTVGAPAPDEACQAARCQPTVSGFTSSTTSMRRWKRPANAPMSQRSNRRKQAFDLAADDDELLAKEQVLADQCCPRCEEGQDEVGNWEAKERDHGSERVPRRLAPGTAGNRAGQSGRGF